MSASAVVSAPKVDRFLIQISPDCARQRVGVFLCGRGIIGLLAVRQSRKVPFGINARFFAVRLRNVLILLVQFIPVRLTT